MTSQNMTQAILAYEPPADAPMQPNWKLEDVEVSSPKEDEILVKMVATGVCHTDIVLSSVPNGALDIFYPKIVGHEGSGRVAAKGSKVTSFDVGDPVLLSFTSCKSCTLCTTGHPAFCKSFNPMNYTGEAARMTTKEGKKDVWGSFFGQSSFSGLSCVKASSAVNAKDLVKSEDELKLFAPLGCGIQTGAGAVLNIGKADAESRVVVLGLGGVGLSAVMAAKMLGCKSIVGVDRVKSRLDLALTFGATSVIDTSDDIEIVEKVRQATDGEGGSILVDTTGVPALLKQALAMLGNYGKLVLVGITPFDYSFDFNVIEFIGTGKSVIACIEGDTIPQKFIPDMISWYRKGVFPFDKLVGFSKVSEFGQAMEKMHKGEVIKPVLLW